MVDLSVALVRAVPRTVIKRKMIDNMTTSGLEGFLCVSECRLSSVPYSQSACHPAVGDCCGLLLGQTSSPRDSWQCSWRKVVVDWTAEVGGFHSGSTVQILQGV